MNAFQILLHSKAFWTALIAVISAIIMRYANVPQDIWIPIEALLGTVVIIFTGDEVSQSLGKQFAKSLREFKLEDKSKK